MANDKTEQLPIFQRAIFCLPVIFCVYGVFEVGKYFVHEPTIEGAVLLFMSLNGAAGFGMIAFSIKNRDRYLRYLTAIAALVGLLIWLAYLWRH